MTSHSNCAVVMLVCLVAAGCCCRGQPRSTPDTNSREDLAVPSEPNEAKDTRDARQTFTGTLRGGIVAVGAETTGWVLETDDGRRIDVDVSKASDAADQLEGKRVVIQGDAVTANWVERGERQLLMADSISPADDGK